jgi:hypothetical protein
MSESRLYEDNVGIVKSSKILNETCVVTNIFNVCQQVDESGKTRIGIVGRPENDLMQFKGKG